MLRIAARGWRRLTTTASDTIISATADPSTWPDAPTGRDVVLHTRVVTGTGGGPEKTILLSASHLDHTNYWLAAAYMHPPGDEGYETVKQRAIEAGSPLFSLPDKGPLDRSVLRSLIALCKHLNVRIWHGHDYKSNMLGLMARPFHSMKLVTTVHGWVRHTSRTPLYYAVDRLCLPYYHHVICVSDDLEDRVRELKVPGDRLTLVRNAIDHKKFTRSGPAANAEMRQAVGTPEGRLVVGAVGRLSPEKAFDNLIKAAQLLLDEEIDFEVWIAGEGDAKDDLQALIDQLGLGDRIRLLGFVSDIWSLYEAMDVFVLSSLREGLPNVVLESLAMGVPTVSTLVAGIPKMIEDGKEGLLCPIGQVQPLADQMRRVLTDAALRDQLRTQGRSLIEREYTFVQRMAKIRAIYDQVMAPPETKQATAPQPADSLDPQAKTQA